MNIERRLSHTQDMEVHATDDDAPKIVGHAALFNSLSEDFGGWRERIAPGAFTESLNADVRALLNHDPNFVLGRTKSSTLTLDEDDKGLYIEADPPEAAWSQDLLGSMRRGDIDQMSFGFFKKEDSWDEIDGELIRTLIKVELFDVSVVTYPAYADTSVAVRMSEQYRQAKGQQTQARSSAARRRQLRLIELV